jgi:uncharacterized protein (TIGR02117 family)
MFFTPIAGKIVRTARQYSLASSVVFCCHETRQLQRLFALFTNQGRAFRIDLFSVLCAGLLAAACQAPQNVSTPKDATADRPLGGQHIIAGKAGATIFVTSNGWHTSIVVPRKSLPPGTLLEAADFPSATYLGFGWGDADYYPARQPTFGMTLRAALTPTPAVVHLVGLRSHPEFVFPKDEVVALRIPKDGYRDLVDFLDGTFVRDGAERARPIAPGLHAFGKFYQATGEFHLFNTCNTWTARGLQAAGRPIQVVGTVTAEEVMVQVRRLAERQRILPQ